MTLGQTLVYTTVDCKNPISLYGLGKRRTTRKRYIKLDKKYSRRKKERERRKKVTVSSKKRLCAITCWFLVTSKTRKNQYATTLSQKIRKGVSQLCARAHATTHPQSPPILPCRPLTAFDSLVLLFQTLPRRSFIYSSRLAVISLLCWDVRRLRPPGRLCGLGISIDIKL